jgi:hypothetical protein
VLLALQALRLTKAAGVAALHEDLLFIVAFPGSAAVRRLALRMLRGIAARVRALPHRERLALEDSGIAGAVTRHVFPFPVARWLAGHATAEIDWRALDDPAKLDPIVGPLLTAAEREAFDSGEYATRDFAALAQPRVARSAFHWLTQGSPASRVADAWDAAEVPVAWRQEDGAWSVTHNALRDRTPVMREGMRRPGLDVGAEIGKPLEAIERLPRARARRVIDVARAALAARCREVNAMTWPNLDEVWWCDLGEGAALAVIGIAAPQRLTLETNTGYVLFANGVPIGYGGVTPLFRQANTGINIFDPFRGSEAAFLWMQMLRAFHALYGSGRFVVNPYQFGAGNAEAIKSGAFWFYYRLGFRPASRDMRTLAQREAARMATDRAYRSDAKTLRALASGDLHLDLPGFAAHDHFDEALLPRIGALAARALATQPVLARERALRGVVRAVAHDLRIDDVARWTPGERRGLGLLAPIVAALPDVAAWRDEDRAALVKMLRAKGAPQERRFAHACAAAPKFFNALRAELAKGSRRKA